MFCADSELIGAVLGGGYKCLIAGLLGPRSVVPGGLYVSWYAQLLVSFMAVARSARLQDFLVWFLVVCMCIGTQGFRFRHGGCYECSLAGLLGVVPGGLHVR
jgi:hypothetical protein